MKIEFSKEDIERIRRIARQEIAKFWYSISEEINKREENDFREDLNLK